MIKHTENKYSKLQYFLWLVSGSEISILKSCPSDYNRHAGIGFTILMTSLFGAFAGGYAGYYFSKTIFGAIVFGIIWGLLIFSIDRTMVVSLKKRPNDSWKNYLGQVLARAVLAALIAFIISIPLELLVFKDNIDIGLSDYKTDKQKELQNSLVGLYQPGKDSIASILAAEKKDSLEAISKSDPQDSNFRILVSTSNRLAGEIGAKRRDEANLRNKARTALSRARYQDPSTDEWKTDRNSTEYRQYLNLNSQANVRRNEAATLSKQKQSIDSDISRLRSEHKQKFESEARAMSIIEDSLAQSAGIKNLAIDSTEKVFKNNLVRIDNSFSVRFDVLTYLSKKKNEIGNREYPSIFFLLWLIRILFFIIEILPTVTKVMTPFGAYDMAVFETEENLRTVQLPAARRKLEEIVAEDRSIEMEERRRQQAYRAAKEGKLHDELVDRIVNTQNLMAEKVLADWERKNGLSN